MAAPLPSDRPDLDALRVTAEEVAAEWGVTLREPFAMGRYSFVAPADGAVLKVTPSRDYDADHEADGLEQWAGRGAVRLLRRDVARRALLQERALPGTDITSLPEDEATGIAVEVGLQLWSVTASPPLRPVAGMIERWFDEAVREEGDGVPLIPLARELLPTLEIGDRSIVHGDFHHYNIVSHEGRHVAIDPKPYRGDPEFDVPTFLWNPVDLEAGGGSLPLDRTLRRLAAFEEAGLDPWKMRAWTAIRAAYLGADDDEAATIRSLL
jgi:streptomycin 6-kinase